MTATRGPDAFSSGGVPWQKPLPKGVLMLEKTSQPFCKLCGVDCYLGVIFTSRQPMAPSRAPEADAKLLHAGEEDRVTPPAACAWGNDHGITGPSGRILLLTNGHPHMVKCDHLAATLRRCHLTQPPAQRTEADDGPWLKQKGALPHRFIMYVQGSERHDPRYHQEHNQLHATLRVHLWRTSCQGERGPESHLGEGDKAEHLTQQRRRSCLSIHKAMHVIR